MPRLCTMSFDGAMLRRGFWLYVWEITSEDGLTVYYLGTTAGKYSRVAKSAHTTAAFQLGRGTNNDALRRHLERVGVGAETSHFRFHAYGPRFSASPLRKHTRRGSTSWPAWSRLCRMPC